MPTLQQYRRAAAADADLLSIVTTTGASAAANQLVVGAGASTLISTEADSTALSGAWAYVSQAGVATSGQQRSVKDLGLAASTGTLTLSTGFTATPGSGLEFELLRRIPAIRDAITGYQGWREAVNAALARVWVSDRISLASVANQQYYDVTSYWWLRSANRVIAIRGEQTNAQEEPPISTIGWRIVPSAGTWKLWLTAPFRGGITFYLDVRRPANSLIKPSGGAWTEQTSPTAGLSADGDEALVEVADLLPGVLEAAYRGLVARAPSESLADVWRQEAARWGVAFRTTKLFDLAERMPPRTTRPVLAGWGLR